MGRDASFYCLTCRVEIYLGYGSATTWLDGARTVDEFDAKVAGDPVLGDLAKNRAMRRALTEHAGHKFFTQSGDWTYEAGGKLMGEFGLMGEGVPIIEDYAAWSHADYSGEK